MSYRRSFRLLLAVLFALPLVLPVESRAQDRRPRTLMELLFRRTERVEPPPPAVVKKAPAKKKAAAAAPPEPEALPKAETAKVVLVVGDFMGSGLAEGLAAVYANNPQVRIVDRTQGNSGLVRTDVYDWPAKVAEILATEKPAAILVMIGSNDRQQMRIGDTSEQAMSAGWTREYAARAAVLASTLAEAKAPVFWVGMPAFKSTKLTQDIVALNDLYRDSATDVGGTYIDIWDGFVDENGAFVTNGPDINGQPVRLRGSDGVTLTRAGKRKVAFYVEKPLAKILGGDAVPAIGMIGPAMPSTVLKPEDIRRIDRTEPMALNDPELDGGAELLGLAAPAAKADATSMERLAIEGIAPVAHEGRADDFGGSRATTAAVPATPAAPSDAAAAETTTAIRR